MSVTIEQLTNILNTRFAGVIKQGSHDENGECCALELLSVCRGTFWTDRPQDVHSLDMRSLNDCYVSDELRTKHMLPLIVAYDGSWDWSMDRKISITTQILKEIAAQLIPSYFVVNDEQKELLLSGDLYKIRDCYLTMRSSLVMAKSNVLYNFENAIRYIDQADYNAAFNICGFAIYNLVNAVDLQQCDVVFTIACEIFLKAAEQNP